MAQSALEVANAALYKLGATIVTSVTGADTSKEGVVVTARLEPVKRALLRMHPWNFAVRRKVILPPDSFAISNVTWVSSQIIEVTHATVTYALASYVTVLGVAGATLANGTFEVSTATAGGVTTRLSVPLATTAVLLGTYVAGTADLIRQSPAFDYSYLYTIPTDCLRLLEIDENTAWDDRWRVEGRNLLTDQSTSIPIKYIYDVTDYTLMDIEFYECLATYLAWDICDHITGDDNKKRALWTDLHGGDGKVGMLPRARFADATEDSQQEMSADTWIAARGIGAGATSNAMFFGN